MVVETASDAHPAQVSSVPTCPGYKGLRFHHTDGHHNPRRCSIQLDYLSPIASCLYPYPYTKSAGSIGSSGSPMHDASAERSQFLASPASSEVVVGLALAAAAALALG